MFVYKNFVIFFTIISNKIFFMVQDLFLLSTVFQSQNDNPFLVLAFGGNLVTRINFVFVNVDFHNIFQKTKNKGTREQGTQL